MNNNQWEVKYTVRLYEPAIISELAMQFEKMRDAFKCKNDFINHIINIGLKENRKQFKTDNKKKTVEIKAEENEMYTLLLDVFKYTSSQFKKIYIDHTILQRLLCAIYNILIALNNDEKLIEEKIEDGFFDDLPPRFEKVINELQKRYSLI